MKDQLVTGFAQAIKSGRFADGELLPGIRQLARAFGVSEITVRHAVRQLNRDGLLAARPRVGLSVCCSGSRAWRGSVLGIKAGPPGMYFASVMEESMAETLRQGGWLYSSVAVHTHGHGGRVDLSPLDLCLDASVSMAVTFHSVRDLSRYMAKSSVWFAEVIPEDRSSAARFDALIECVEAVSELAEDLRAAGVRTVLSVYQRPAVRESFSSILESSGLKVRQCQIRPVAGRNTQEDVQRAGLTVFERMLERGDVVEDAVVCNDDYLAAGILSAFDRRGIRMPSDIRFATLSNKGLGPVYAQELTRIEMDPVRYGSEIGARLVAELNGERRSNQVLLKGKYFRGGTI